MVNLFFDVDDTLYDQLHPFAKAYHKIFGYQYQVSCEAIYKRSRLHSDDVFDDVTSGQMTREDMYIYRISKAFADYGISVSDEKALEFQQTYSKYQMDIELIPEMKQLLEWSRHNNGQKGIITNGPAGHQRKKIIRLGLYEWIEENHIFISEEVKVSKPDIHIFYLVQEKLSLNPEATYYIGDSYRNDVIGAKRAGWKAIWINCRKRPLPDDSNIRPDYTISEYRELVDLLQRGI